MSRVLRPSAGAVAALGLVVWGLWIGLQPLGDNSFLTHLATGRLILDTGGIPRTDPYSFTALGEPWVVQSWLASLVYGLIDEWWGGRGLQVLTGVLSGTLALLLWRLTRPAGTLLPRLGLAALGVAVGSGVWSERPLMLGLVCLAVTLWVLDDGPDPRWLVPVFWVWVNTHGSWPLGLVAIAAIAAGTRLDGGSPRRPLRVLLWAAVGVAAGAVNPLGPRLLVFPVELLARQDALSVIVEWQAPRFEGWSQRLFLVQIVIVVLALVRRPRWTSAVPSVVFVAAALLSARNVAAASIVLVFASAALVAGLGTIETSLRTATTRIAAAAVAILGAVVVAAALREDAFSTSAYPVAALAWMGEQGLLGPDSRVIAQDWVGNYREVIAGTEARVFVDDRYDMYPDEVRRQYESLLNGEPDWQDVLAERGATAVLWERDRPLGALLAASGDWEVRYTDERFTVAVPAGEG